MMMRIIAQKSSRNFLFWNIVSLGHFTDSFNIDDRSLRLVDWRKQIGRKLLLEPFVGTEILLYLKQPVGRFWRSRLDLGL